MICPRIPAWSGVAESPTQSSVLLVVSAPVKDAENKRHALQPKAMVDIANGWPCSFLLTQPQRLF